MFIFNRVLLRFIFNRVLQRHWLISCLSLGSIVATTTQADNSTGFGRALNESEVAALPGHVFADGTGLPFGSGTAAQGREIYAQHCAGCHGSVGQGGRAIELVGDRSLLATDIPDKGIAVFWPYAPPLFEYIQRAMPPAEPYSLSADEVYAVVAYLLELNGLTAPEQEVNADYLSNLSMPNRDGFKSDFD